MVLQICHSLKLAIQSMAGLKIKDTSPFLPSLKKSLYDCEAIVTKLIRFWNDLFHPSGKELEQSIQNTTARFLAQYSHLEGHIYFPQPLLSVRKKIFLLKKHYKSCW